jgi:hypothetical protein
MAKLKRVRKLLFAAVGFAASLAVLLPPQAPSKMREGAAVVIALATLLGVYQARNAPPPAPPTLFARRHDARGGYPSGDTPASELPPPRSGTKPPE